MRFCTQGLFFKLPVSATKAPERRVPNPSPTPSVWRRERREEEEQGCRHPQAAASSPYPGLYSHLYLSRGRHRPGYTVIYISHVDAIGRALYSFISLTGTPLAGLFIPPLYKAHWYNTQGGGGVSYSMTQWTLPVLRVYHCERIRNFVAPKELHPLSQS